MPAGGQDRIHWVGLSDRERGSHGRERPGGGQIRLPARQGTPRDATQLQGKYCGRERGVHVTARRGPSLSVVSDSAS